MPQLSKEPLFEPGDQFPADLGIDPGGDDDWKKKFPPGTVFVDLRTVGGWIRAGLIPGLIPREAIVEAKRELAGDAKTDLE